VKQSTNYQIAGCQRTIFARQFRQIRTFCLTILDFPLLKMDYISARCQQPSY